MRGEIKWTDSDDYHWCKNNPDRRTFGSDSCYSWYGPPFNGGDSSDGFANSGKIVGQWDSGNTWRGDLSVGSFDGTDGFGSAVAYITSEKMKLEPLSERKFSLERKSSNTKINFPINISDSTTSRQSTNSRSNQNLYSANYTVENIEGILGGTLYLGRIFKTRCKI